MCEGGSSLSTKTCSAMEMSSHRSFQCTMNQLWAAVEDPSHRTYKYKHLHQDEVQFSALLR